MKNEELEHLIDKSFRMEPTFHLPVDFARIVTHSIAKREQWKADLGEYISLLAIFTGLLSVVVGLYYYLDKELVMQVFSFASMNIIQVAFAVFILNFILFADKVLLRLLFTRWNKKV